MNPYINNSECNIILLGDIMLDHNLKGNCNKIANEGPIPVVNIYSEKYSIGGCGNVLLNMLSLGTKNIHLFSRIGSDNNGQHLQSLLPLNVNNMLITDSTIPTITKTRIYADNKIVARYDTETISNLTISQEDEVLVKIKDIILASNNKGSHISSVVFSDYNKGFFNKDIVSKCY